MERKLASIQLIDDLSPIEGADMIELATVQGWKVVVQKGLYNVGDKVIYFEIDSWIPAGNPEYEFLRKSSYKLYHEQEGFRLKTIRLRGQVSQGLLMPLTILNAIPEAMEFEEMKVGTSDQPYGKQLQFGPYDDALHLDVGADVTDLLGVKKWEPPLPAELSGKVRGNFPKFVPKTEEDRIQNKKKSYETLKASLYYETEKMEGCSATFYISASVFGVASRNWDLEESEGNTFWKVANELQLPKKLADYSQSIALQGEMIGEGIQGNIYKLKGQTVKFYNAWDIHEQRYLAVDEFGKVMKDLELDTVPILSYEYRLPDSIDELITHADGKSQLNPQTDREGLVIRSHDRKTSFKVISNSYLLKSKN